LEPPEPTGLALGASATLVAAVFASLSTAVGAMPHARQAALPETLQGARRRVWVRYLERRRYAHARWVLIQALGVAGGAALAIQAGLPSWLSVAVVVGVFVLGAHLLSTLLQTSAQRFVPVLVQVMYPLGLLVAPFADPVAFLSRAFRRNALSEVPPPSVTETEVEFLVTEGEQSGALDHDRSEMIRNVLEFGDTQASDLMVPRTQVTAFNVLTPLADVLDTVKDKAHSRYPVYRERIDNVVGILHLKDLFLHATNRSSPSIDLESLLRKPMFVPANQLGSSVLTEMRKGRHHMAIVIDEYGGMAGVLTLEDVLEEIVGDIQDEHDDEEPTIVTLPNGHIVVDASVPIAELNRHVAISLPDDGDYNSLGGFIVEMMGRVPEPGAVLERMGHTFLVKTADERHVTKVEIIPETPAPPTELQATA
jgi:CBS domain containing-hemolysin-like protein